MVACYDSPLLHVKHFFTLTKKSDLDNDQYICHFGISKLDLDLGLDLEEHQSR